MKLQGIYNNNKLIPYSRSKFLTILGKNAGNIGSINRIYQFCRNSSSTPLYCVFGLPTFNTIWSNPFGNGLTGLNKSVNVLAFDSYGNLFVGGSFNNANGISCNCISIFNTKKNIWYNPFKNSLNENLFKGNGPVRTIVPTSSKVYIGGLTNDEQIDNDGINGIAVWNFSNPKKFTPLGGGTSSSDCNCIAVSSNYLAIGNGFGWVYNNIPPSIQDYTLASGIALWNLNSSVWERLEPGEQGIGGVVNTLKQVQNGTFIGGRFNTFINNPNNFNNIAFYNSSQSELFTLGEGIYYDGDNYYINSIDVNSLGVVYIAGKFPATGNNNTFNNTFNNIGKYDGSTWSSLGTGLNGIVNCIKFAPNGDLYATGEFTATGDGLIQLNYIARWDGNNWYPISGGLNGKGNYLCFDNEGSLYVGGEFTMAGNINCNCIAKFSTICYGCL